jgi:hypothetical protein
MDKDWDVAKNRLDEVIEQYKELIGISGVNPLFGLMYLSSLANRYNAGERSDELHQEMMECE